MSVTHRYVIVMPLANALPSITRYLEKTADQVAALGDVKYMIVTARDNADGKTRLKSFA